VEKEGGKAVLSGNKGEEAAVTALKMIAFTHSCKTSVPKNA